MKLSDIKKNASIDKSDLIVTKEITYPGLDGQIHSGEVQVLRARLPDDAKIGVLSKELTQSDSEQDVTAAYIAATIHVLMRFDNEQMSLEDALNLGGGAAAAFFSAILEVNPRPDMGKS